MSIGIAYEGDGFIRCGPAVVGKGTFPGAEVRAKPALIETGAMEASPSISEVDQRARAMRREFLSAWLCRLLDRWS